MSEVMRQNRLRLNLSQADLAAAAGVDKRQIRRYEAGEQQPLLSVAVAIANALKISVGDLAGIPNQGLNLTGDWWASWQTFYNGEEVITAQEVQFRQEADLVRVETITRGIDVEDGGYHWSGELRVWDNQILMGWYAARDGGTRSKGTMYFVLHNHGQWMTGRWVGASYDGDLVTGLGAMGKSEQEVKDLIAVQKESGTHVP